MMTNRRHPNNRETSCPMGTKVFFTKVLARAMAEDRHAQKLQGKQLYVTNEESCYHFSATEHTSVSENVPCLTGHHEEADTRIFFYAQHAAQEGHSSILIRSSDTDVEVLAP